MFVAHISRKPQDRPALERETFEARLEGFDRTYDKTADLRREWLSIRTALTGQSQGPSACKRYLMLAERLHASTAIHAGLADEYKDRPALQTALIQLAIQDLAQALDGVSYYREAAKDDEVHGRGEDPWGAGFQFRPRSDYLLGRLPNYLAIEGVWSDSPSAARAGEWTGVRVYGVVPTPSENLRKTMEERPEYFSTLDGIEYLRVASLQHELAASLINDALPEKKSLKLVVRRPADGYAALAVVEIPLGRFTPLPVVVKAVDLPGGEAALYLRLNNFRHDHLSDTLKAELGSLEHRLGVQNRRVAGLILDLRGNPGGSTDQVNRVLSLFLRSGTPFAHLERVAWKETPDGSQNGKSTRFRTLRIRFGTPDYFEGRENVVVLVDRESASGAEMLPAALHDYRKAWVVGERTYGKGLAMTPISLPDPIGGVLNVDDSYTYSAKGETYLMSSYFIDSPYVDPANEEQNRRTLKAEDGNYPYGIEHELRGATADGSISIPRPARPKASLPFANDEKPWIDDATAATLKTYAPAAPESCRHTPAKDGDAFVEESDCLLDVGKLYLQRMLDARGI